MSTPKSPKAYPEYYEQIMTFDLDTDKVLSSRYQWSNDIRTAPRGGVAKLREMIMFNAYDGVVTDLTMLPQPLRNELVDNLCVVVTRSLPIFVVLQETIRSCFQTRWVRDRLVSELEPHLISWGSGVAQTVSPPRRQSRPCAVRQRGHNRQLYGQ
jgi:hypothetical protein